MQQPTALKLSAAAGFLAVALGAFGAHALKSTLAAHQTAAIWETAVFYHLIHALLLFFLANSQPFQRGPWFCFAAGILIFSGSLYVLALSGARHWGAVTPFGGVSLLAGWFWLLFTRRRTT